MSKAEIYPKVSFIITAHNEEGEIQNKLENSLGQDYPPEMLEIIVASDYSTDRTDEIVRCFEQRGVILTRASKRKGKEAAQRYAVEKARGEILVFSDVRTILDKHGIKQIASNFADPTVGCVSSEDRLMGSSGESAYVQYEMLLRKLETRVNTLVGLSGSFFAARREVCQNWSEAHQSDFNTLLNAIKLGYRGVTDPEVIGYYRDVPSEKKEFRRKIRIVLRGLTVFFSNLELLNIFKYGLFSWQIFSHKLCRWLVPFLLIIAFISNTQLLPVGGWYVVMFLLQVVFYVTAFLGFFLSCMQYHRIFRIPTFFLLVNCSILMAWRNFFLGKRQVFWEPSKR